MDRQQKIEALMALSAELGVPIKIRDAPFGGDGSEVGLEPGRARVFEPTPRAFSAGANDQKLVVGP